MSVAHFDPYQAPQSEIVQPQPVAFPGLLRVGPTVAAAQITLRTWPVVIVGAFLLQEVLAIGFGFVAGCIGEIGLVASIFAQLVAFVFASHLGIGFTRLLLDAARSRTPRLKTLFSGGDAIFPTAVAAILSGVLVAAGTLVLVVPGIIVALALSFVQILVADRGLGPIDAIKESVRLTRGNRTTLFLLGLVCAVIGLLGVCALLVGALWAVPLVQLVFVHAYLRVSGE